MSIEDDTTPPERRSRASEPPARARSVEQLSDQLQALYVRVKVQEERDQARFERGAQSMSDLRHAIDDLKGSIEEVKDMAQAANQAAIAANGPRKIPWGLLLPLTVTLLLAAGSALWTLARYPDGERFERAQERNETKIEGVESRIGQVEKAQVGLASDVRAATESIDRTNSKIDTLITAVRNRGR